MNVPKKISYKELREVRVVYWCKKGYRDHSPSGNEDRGQASHDDMYKRTHRRFGDVEQNGGLDEVVDVGVTQGVCRRGKPGRHQRRRRKEVRKRTLCLYPVEGAGDGSTRTVSLTTFTFG